MNINFEVIDNKETISSLEKEWRNSLTFPLDDYWEYQLECCIHWALKLEGNIIGYACLTEKNTLYQFYITPKYLMHGTEILEEFIKQREIKKALIGTNNPICFSLIMHFQKSMEIYGYTFKDMEEANLEEKEGEFRVAETKDLERLVSFSHEILGAPEDWFRDYIGNWINREEFFVLEKQDEIIGTLEIRTTDLYTQIACLGIVVSPKYRRQGYGSYLLSKGKSISKSRNIEPICACTEDNIPSRKAIEKSGFRKWFLDLLIEL